MFASIESGKELMKNLSSADHSLGSIWKCRDNAVSGLGFVATLDPPAIRVTSPSHANPNKSRSSTVKEGAKMTPTVTFILIDFQCLYCTSVEKHATVRKSKRNLESGELAGKLTHCTQYQFQGAEGVEVHVP